MAVVSEYVRALPAAPLLPYVGWYSGYRQEGLEPARHRGLPSPYLTLIVTLDDPLVVAAHPDARQAPAEYETLLGGLHTTPALITHEGRQSGIQVGLKPLGARALLGLPAGELAGLDFHAGEVLGRVATEIQESGAIFAVDYRGLSVKQSVELRTALRDAEASFQAVLRRRDPMLLQRLEFASEGGGVGISSSSYEDIRAAAAWLASMFKSAQGS